jgi:hypothetical protein
VAGQVLPERWRRRLAQPAVGIPGTSGGGAVMWWEWWEAGGGGPLLSTNGGGWDVCGAQAE